MAKKEDKTQTDEIEETKKIREDAPAQEDKSPLESGSTPGDRRNNLKDAGKTEQIKQAIQEQKTSTSMDEDKPAGDNHSLNSLAFTPERGDLDALAGGYFKDPFRILGPHVVEGDVVEGDTERNVSPPDDDPALVIRTFQPLADSVSIRNMDDGEEHEMHRIHEAGIYQANFPGRSEAFRYRLLSTRQGEITSELEDPYRFREEWITEYERYLYGEGRFLDIYDRMGAHFRTVDGVTGVQFAVWAPNAERVSVIGPFNRWDDRVHAMQSRENGLWELFIPDLQQGTDYKYSIKSQYLGYKADKSDPYAFYAQRRPETGSLIWDLDTYEWNDQSWMEERQQRQSLDEPINVYEVHLGSWKRQPEDNGFLNYRDLAHQLVEHVKELGYTHVELLPITEHPYDGSWGYQTTGYFSPTSRFGTPDDFMYFVDYCHQNEIGVILDWVPAHFPKDAHGLAYFDGTHLYEHEDPRQGEYQEWGTKVFNFGRNEVCNFLLASALFWLNKYHIDGLRVDAVAAMLYLDYNREQGEWIPNKYGGRENLEAINFIRTFNEVTHEEASGILTIAEESTAWPMVSRPTYTGGLGFDLKWNMGWMHDTLEYFQKDPIHRRYHHGLITFSLVYAFSENFILPFSHDEVVHLKKSMLDKMPGDRWQKFANLRTLYAYMTGHPGKKLLFMGGEFGQWREWTEEYSLDWHLLQHDSHRQLQKMVGDLNRLYQNEPALYEADLSWEGFAWIDLHDVDNSIISFRRIARNTDDFIIVVCNFTPIPRHNYRVGLPSSGAYVELFNTDWREYGGSDVRNEGLLYADDTPWQSGSHSIEVNLPPLGVIYLQPA